MDLSGYLKKNRASHSRFETQRDKFCLECGKQLQKDGSFLYIRNFCSEKCMQNYITTARK